MSEFPRVSQADARDEKTRPGCPRPVQAQAESLEALRARWYDESSREYDAVALAWLLELLTGVLDDFPLPRPYIYPMPESLARAEWSSTRWEIVANIDLIARYAAALAVDVESDEVHERTFLLGSPGDESTLGIFLTEHLAVR